MVFQKALLRRKVCAFIELFSLCQYLNNVSRSADRFANWFGLSYITFTFPTRTHSECGRLTIKLSWAYNYFVKVLYGQSIGGAVAIDLASRNPAKVVLEGLRSWFFFLN